MKKKILGLLLAICMIVSLIPVAALAEDAAPTSWVALGGDDNVKNPTEGCDPFYFKTVDGAVVEGGSEEDYQIKLFYPAGGNITIVLNGADIFTESTRGAINIGRHETYPQFHEHGVDIIIAADSHIETGAAACAPIHSFVTGDLNIMSIDGAKLDLEAYMYYGSGTHAAIRNNGNINLVNANISIKGIKDEEADKFIHSDNGSIVIDGGNLDITTGGIWSGDATMHVVDAPKGEIVIQNGANVAIWNKRANGTFFAGNGITISESSVKVAVTHENGFIFNTKPTLNFADPTAVEIAASATAPVATWDTAIGMSIDAPADTAAYDEEKFADYKFFTVGVPGYTWIAIGKQDFGVSPTPGCDPIYFKTNSETGDVTMEGSEEDYQVKLYYPIGGRPTIVLNGAYIASGYAPINIGRDSSYGQYLDCSADIIVKADSYLYSSSGSAAAIKSYIKGNVTIKSENGAKLDVESYLYYGAAHAAIRSAGNIKIENVALSIWGNKPEEADMMIYSDNGGIQINGGSLKIMTGGPWSGEGEQHVVHAPNGAIAIQNADVTIWNRRGNGTFVAGKGITISESSVEVALTHENGFIFGSTPVLSYVDIDFMNSAVSAEVPVAEGESVFDMVITAPEAVDEYDEDAIDTYNYLSISAHVHDFLPATCEDGKECDICGYIEGEGLGHTPGDAATCTTAQTCTACGVELAEALGHTPAEDDGDCTTAVKCTVCGEELVPAKDHTPAHADDDCATEDLCSVCGKVAIPAGECTPEADDGDCTTAVKCAICGKEAIAAKEAHTPAEDDGDCTTAIKCTVCGKETTAAKEAHTATDDDDCTTAVKCTVCGKETVAAKEAHTYTDNKDTTCDNEGCKHTRKVEDAGSKPGTNGSPQTGDNSNITLWIALLVVSAIGMAAVVVFGKKRFATK